MKRSLFGWIVLLAIGLVAEAVCLWFSWNSTLLLSLRDGYVRFLEYGITILGYWGLNYGVLLGMAVLGLNALGKRSARARLLAWPPVVGLGLLGHLIFLYLLWRTAPTDTLVWEFEGFWYFAAAAIRCFRCTAAWSAVFVAGVLLALLLDRRRDPANHTSTV